MLIEHLHIQSQRKYIYIFSPREKIYICIFSLRKEISTYPVTRIRYLHIDLQGIYIYIQIYIYRVLHIQYQGDVYTFILRENISTYSITGRRYLQRKSHGEEMPKILSNGMWPLQTRALKAYPKYSWNNLKISPLPYNIMIDVLSWFWSSVPVWPGSSYCLCATTMAMTTASMQHLHTNCNHELINKLFTMIYIIYIYIYIYIYI